MIINKHIMPILAHNQLIKFYQQPKLIEDYYAAKLEKLSIRIVRYHHAVLRNSLNDAVK